MRKVRRPVRRVKHAFDRRCEGSGSRAPSFAEERAEEREIALYRSTFRDGRDGHALRHHRPELRRTWLRGRAYAEQMRAGLRPLDTVRRKP